LQRPNGSINSKDVLSDEEAAEFQAQLAKKPDGTVEEWMIEAGTPNTLLRRGFTRDSLKKGTEVIVDGYQSKDGSLRANGRDITLPNGQTLFLGSNSPDAPDQDKTK
jgi:hypothetical protein